jgi:hypothetical protein
LASLQVLEVVDARVVSIERSQAWRPVSCPTREAAAQGARDAVGAAGGRSMVAPGVGDVLFVLVAVVAPHQRAVHEAVRRVELGD